MKSRQPKLDSSSIVEIALKKILNFFGLQCIKTRFSRSIPYVAEFTGAYGTVRQFKTIDRFDALLMSIYFHFYEDCSPFPCCGTWDIFKDDDNATLDLFTKTVKKFDLCGNRFYAKHDISNPFFGCKSPEEVLVKYDLLTT